MAQRTFRLADYWLCSLGIAMLVLSLMLVPANALLADTGSGGTGPLGPAAQCLNNNGCNSGGCVLQINKLGETYCPIQQYDETNCSWSMNGCNGCGCRGCYRRTGTICGCKCQQTSPGCGATDLCNTPA